jgi:hypothetical protein
MENNTAPEIGSYIVRDKKGTYMGGYSKELGEFQARDWATECAKRSKGILYYRSAPREPEKEIGRFLDYGKKSKQERKKKGG